ncbi:MAG: hypothetical protein GC138_07860 [Gammaproteobacteria bacterium]|nr:hypothetical protein [Gammaproteobacteria bacterium]
MKTLRVPSRHRQRGATLIAAIFLITALAVLGASMTRMMVVASTDTIDEWRSAQAFYAAESGVEWVLWDLLRNGGSGTSANRTVTEGSWADTAVSTTNIGGKTLYTVTSTGKAGGTAADPVTERRLNVTFMP